MIALVNLVINSIFNKIKQTSKCIAHLLLGTYHYKVPFEAKKKVVFEISKT